MLLRIGNVEAEIKVACVMSAPRLGFLDNFFCVSTALAPHKISPIKVSGAFWGQCLQRGMEQVIDTHDVILTVDYDTVFSSRTVEAMLALLMHSGMDASPPKMVALLERAETSRITRYQIRRRSHAARFSCRVVSAHAPLRK